MGGILMAFENFKIGKGIFGSEWIWFENFQKLFSGSAFPTALRNTVAMAVLSLVLGFLPPIILALLFSECRPKRYKRVTQLMTYMPYFVSSVVVCALVTEFLGRDGAVTGFLTALGLKEQNWLANTDIPVFWLIFMSIASMSCCSLSRITAASLSASLSFCFRLFIIKVIKSTANIPSNTAVIPTIIFIPL